MSVYAPIPVCFHLTTLSRVVFKYYTVFEIKDTKISISHTNSNTRVLCLETPHTMHTKVVFPFMVALHFWFTVTCDEQVLLGSSLRHLFQNTVSLLFLVSKWTVSSFSSCLLSMMAAFMLSQLFHSNLSFLCTDVSQI